MSTESITSSGEQPENGNVTTASTDVDVSEKPRNCNANGQYGHFGFRSSASSIHSKPAHQTLDSSSQPSPQRANSDHGVHHAASSSLGSVFTGNNIARLRFPATDSTRSSVQTDSSRPLFRSRRIVKGTIDRPELRQKDPRRIWITLFPVVGFLAGIFIIGYLSWSGYSSVSKHKYCKVFVDDFSNGFNPDIWQKQVETGGFNNGEFALGTGDDENVFIRDGQLVIRPTLQTESYLASTSVTNLTADGTCTSSSKSACVLSANMSAGHIVQPVKSGRISTKNTAVIRYGRVEIEAKLVGGDWLLSQMLMFPAQDSYGVWPASGEIDIGIARGNNYSYGSDQGNQLLQSSMHWGPDSTEDRWASTTGTRKALHTTFDEGFHTFGLEWTDKYLFTWIDSRLAQVMYVRFDQTFYNRGGFGATYANGSRILDPWTGAGTGHVTPFDRPFYLVLGVGVGGTSGWFVDGEQGKPWADASTTPREEFWEARDQWAPTWNSTGRGEMVVRKVSMWQQCDDGATDLTPFG